MSAQTILNIILSLVTVYLAYRNWDLTSKKDTQRESQEMTEIRVQLNQVMSMLQDMQKDIRTSTADFRMLSDRVLKIEMKLEAAYVRIDELKEKIKDGTV